MQTQGPVSTFPYRAEERGVQSRDKPGNLWSGHLFGLQIKINASSLWPGSAWAALCGAIASGRIGLGAPSLLRLLVVLFLADPVLGGIWELVSGTDWFAPFARAHLPSEEAPVKSLPYTSPGSPGYHASRWLAGVLAWWRRDFRPYAGTEFLSLILTVAVAILLASLLGPQVALVILVTFGLMAMALFAPHRHLWRAILEWGLPWLMGHLTFGPLNWPSVVLALAYTGAYYAGLILLGGQWRAATRWLNGSQIAAVALLVFVKEPILAGIVGLLLLPQLLLQPFLWRGEAEWWYWQRSQLWLMAGILIAALAIGGAP